MDELDDEVEVRWTEEDWQGVRDRIAEGPPE